MDEPFIVPVALFICITVGIVLRGPIGKALADRLAGRAHGLEAGDRDRLLGELDEMRRRLGEVEERLDFAERLLAKERESHRLVPPR